MAKIDISSRFVYHYSAASADASIKLFLIYRGVYGEEELRKYIPDAIARGEKFFGKNAVIHTETCIVGYPGLEDSVVVVYNAKGLYV